MAKNGMFNSAPTLLMDSDSILAFLCGAQPFGILARE